MIHVIATIEVAPGRREDFLREFRANVPNVLAEDGCLHYEPTVDGRTDIAAQVAARPNVVVVVEQWASVEALKKHLVAPHMVAFRSQVRELVGSVSLQILEPS